MTVTTGPVGVEVGVGLGFATAAREGLDVADGDAAGSASEDSPDEQPAMRTMNAAAAATHLNGVLTIAGVSHHVAPLTTAIHWRNSHPSYLGTRFWDALDGTGGAGYHTRGPPCPMKL